MGLHDCSAGSSLCLQRWAWYNRREFSLRCYNFRRQLLYTLAMYRTLGVPMQIEGADGGEQHSLGSEYYTTLRSEADNDVNAATIASEEAEGEINRWGMVGPDTTSSPS